MVAQVLVAVLSTLLWLVSSLNHVSQPEALQLDSYKPQASRLDEVKNHGSRETHEQNCSKYLDDVMEHLARIVVGEPAELTAAKTEFRAAQSDYKALQQKVAASQREKQMLERMYANAPGVVEKVNMRWKVINANTLLADAQKQIQSKRTHLQKMDQRLRKVALECCRNSAQSGTAFMQLLSSGAKGGLRRTAQESKPPSTVAAIPGFKTTMEILREGSGDARVAKGSVVTVHATGVIQETGRKFWSTKDSGQQPFTYQAGLGNVITGWDQGCLGMKVGEERKLVIPADEGYGAGGFPAWGIPSGGTLAFTLECLSIKA